MLSYLFSPQTLVAVSVQIICCLLVVNLAAALESNTPDLVAIPIESKLLLNPLPNWLTGEMYKWTLYIQDANPIVTSSVSATDDLPTAESRYRGGYRRGWGKSYYKGGGYVSGGFSTGGIAGYTYPVYPVYDPYPAYTYYTYPAVNYGGYGGYNGYTGFSSGYSYGSKYKGKFLT